MKKYYIIISGGAMNIEANSPEEAIQSIKNHLNVYCSFHAKEIGKDCDELGYSIPHPIPVGKTFTIVDKL